MDYVCFLQLRTNEGPFNSVPHEMGDVYVFDLVEAAIHIARILVRKFALPPLHGIQSHFSHTYILE